jgi:hypothetical protein
MEQFPQKCAAVLRPELQEKKKIERFRDLEKNGNALSPDAGWRTGSTISHDRHGQPVHPGGGVVPDSQSTLALAFSLEGQVDLPISL